MPRTTALARLSPQIATALVDTCMPALVLKELSLNFTAGERT